MKKILNNLINLKLSDKILLIIFSFSTVLFFFVKYIFDGSLSEILVLGGFIYVMSFITTYVVSRKFSERILDLTYKVEEMAAGNLVKKLEVKSNDEISQLMNAFNELITRLKSEIALDVTKHKQLSQAKTDFVALASHQLRTPLSIIKWYIDFLLNGDAGNFTEEQENYLKQVYLSNERLIELVNALLDVSRIDLGTFSIEPEMTDIVFKAEEAIEKFGKDISSKNLYIKKRFQKIPTISIDPRLTGIVFEQILSNSVKYTPDGGTVSVDIKKTEKDVLIEISDTGCGIPREEQPKVFSKLFRAYNVKKIESIGTGLGLYIVKAIIEKSGGKIWFESPSLDILLSEDNKEKDVPIDKRHLGTSFFITIPLKGMKPKAGTKKLSSVK